MKKLLAVVMAVSLLGAVPAFANEGHEGHEGKGGKGGMMDPEKRLERMTEKLSLTPDQVTQIRAIQESQRPKFEALMKEGQAQIRAVLTPDQQAKFDEMKEKMKEKWQEKKEGRKEAAGEKSAAE